MGIGILLLLLAVVILAGAFWLCQKSIQQSAQFDQNSSRIDGEVTNLDTRWIRGTLSNRNAYFVGYTYFTDPAGSRRAGNHRISDYAAQHLKVGDKIHINYSPDNPDVSSPAPEYLDADAERSRAWSPMYSAAGLAVGLVLVSFTLFSNDAQKAAATQQVVAQNQAQIAEVTNALNSRIAEWRKTATSSVVRLSATDAGFSSTTDYREVYYGNCTVARQSRFYLIILRTIYVDSTPPATWLVQGYSYTPGSTNAADCVPPGWTVFGDKVVGNDWHAVSLLMPPQIPFYQLTATAETPVPPQ